MIRAGRAMIVSSPLKDQRKLTSSHGVQHRTLIVCTMERNLLLTSHLVYSVPFMLWQYHGKYVRLNSLKCPRIKNTPGYSFRMILLATEEEACCG